MSFRAKALIAATALSVAGVGTSAPAEAHVGTGIAIPAYSYEYVQRCRVFERWNPYWGQYQQVKRCN